MDRSLCIYTYDSKNFGHSTIRIPILIHQFYISKWNNKIILLNYYLLSLFIFSSTIIFISFLKFTFGSQPSSFFAFDASPIKGPVSVGLINLLSTITCVSQFKPTYLYASSANSCIV